MKVSLSEKRPYINVHLMSINLILANFKMPSMKVMRIILSIRIDYLYVSIRSCIHMLRSISEGITRPDYFPIDTVSEAEMFTASYNETA